MSPTRHGARTSAAGAPSAARAFDHDPPWSNAPTRACLAGDVCGPSKNFAQMGSSTIARAKPRLLMRAPIARPHNRYRGISDAETGAQRICSPAGLHRRPWLARLRRALAEDLFVLHYQPIVALSDGSLAHQEALVRLADEPDGSVIAPGHFLPAAERYGLICEIDRMVLDKVAALLGAENTRDGAAIAINLSALSVTDPGMLAYIERGLREHGADPARLVIEVTETASISDMGRAKDFCAGAQELGCAVALDDFGAGFGSFHYVKHLPFRYLKIDGAFIRGLAHSEHDQLVVKAIVGLVRGMGRHTIAEFVGDRRTMSLLREYGVDYAQGFEVGRPQAELAVMA